MYKGTKRKMKEEENLVAELAERSYVNSSTVSRSVSGALVVAAVRRDSYGGRGRKGVRAPALSSVLGLRKYKNGIKSARGTKRKRGEKEDSRPRRRSPRFCRSIGRAGWS